MHSQFHVGLFWRAAFRCFLAAAVYLTAIPQVSAGPRGIGSNAARTATVASPATVNPKTAFNRNVYGGASGLGPGMLNRAYRIDNGLKSPGGARAMGLRSHRYANDGRAASQRLPTVNAKGQPLSYQTTYMREGGHARKNSNARLVTGSDGRAYVTRHYQNFKRVQ